MPDQLGMIATPLKRRVIAHVDELDPDRVTVNGYQPLLRAPLILLIVVVIGHVRQLVELTPTRRLILLMIIVVVRGRLRGLFLFMFIVLLLLCSLMIWENCTHLNFRDMFQRGRWLLLFEFFLIDHAVTRIVFFFS